MKLPLPAFLRRKRRATLIYRPGTGVGIGHILFAQAGFQAIAEKIGARFLTTLDNTLFAPHGREREILESCFRRDPSCTATFGIEALHEALAGRKTPGTRLLVGRDDLGRRSEKEFPGLRNAHFLDRWDDERISLEVLSRYEIVFIDNITAESRLTDLCPPMRPLLWPADRIAAAARAVSPDAPYLAVHLRHGNGEHLHGRAEGTTGTFGEYMARIADRAMNTADEAGLAHIVCLSDNADTARDLAARTGGTAPDPGHLPDKPHMDYFRSASSAADHADRLEKVLIDLAVLGNGARIVGAPSLFCHAAALYGPVDRMRLYAPDGRVDRFAQLPRPEAVAGARPVTGSRAP
jgi:hypothetical protein